MNTESANTSVSQRDEQVQRALEKADQVRVVADLYGGKLLGFEGALITLADAYRRSQADDQTLRLLLAIAYSGLALYRDDGELQDNSAAPFIDFKRMTAAQIDAAIRERGAKEYLRERSTLARDPAPTVDGEIARQAKNGTLNETMLAAREGQPKEGQS